MGHVFVVQYVLIITKGDQGGIGFPGLLICKENVFDYIGNHWSMTVASSLLWQSLPSFIKSSGSPTVFFIEQVKCNATCHVLSREKNKEKKTPTQPKKGLICIELFIST